MLDGVSFFHRCRPPSCRLCFRPSVFACASCTFLNRFFLACVISALDAISSATVRFRSYFVILALKKSCAPSTTVPTWKCFGSLLVSSVL